jgi:predicted metal-binding membrane protein
MLVRVNTEKPLIASLVGLTVMAWLSLFLWGLSPYARFLNHESLEGLKLQDSAPVLAVMTMGWTLMLVAMMLPTSLPLIALFHRMAAQRPNRTLLVGLLLTGYLGVWMLFGLLVHLADLGLHTLADEIAWLDNHALISSATLIAAGIFQFTPLKYKCLDKCRSPMSFVLERWRGSRQEWHSFMLGLTHGIFCIGCCWALMLLMFGVGMGSLAWMFVLGAVMAIEKNMPWGRRLSVPLGVLLLSVGIPLLYQALTVA